MTDVKSVGAFAAKTHFSALLEQVEAGASFVITKHGAPVARLVPLTSEAPAPTLTQLRERASRLRAQVKANSEEIRDWIDEGRL